MSPIRWFRPTVGAGLVLLVALMVSPGLALAQAPPASSPPAQTPPASEKVEPPPKKKKKKKKRGFTVKPGLLVQMLMSYDSLVDKEPIWRIPRARAVLRAGWGRLLRAKLSVDFGDFEVDLKSAYIEARAYGRHLRVRAGRFKRPFSRYWLTSSSDQGTSTRTFLKRSLGIDRDLGVMLHNGIKGDSGFRWAVGLFGDFDGSDIGEEGIPPMKPTLAARVSWGMRGLDGYVETDRRGGGLRAGVGASTVVFIATNKPRRTGLRWEVDAVLKYEHATLMLELDGLTDKDYGHDRLGAYAHAAYRPLEWLEVAARWSGLIPKEADMIYELTGAINTYLFDEHLRATVDVSFLHSPIPGAGALDPDGWRIRTMLQVR